MSILDNMPIFDKGSQWDADKIRDLEVGRKRDKRIIFALGFCLVAVSVSLATLAPLRRTVPYVVMKDSQTGNVEVLQSFDNRTVGNQELMDKYWARLYVQAREQYNWYLVGSDYELVQRLTDSAIFPEYGGQFAGEQGLDKVFGNFTERRIKVLAVTPSPTNPNQMVVRFERTTTSRGMVAETPTIFTANIAFRYVPKTFGAEADLIRNPVGYQVYSYRRDFEQTPTAPAAAASAPGGAQ